MKISMKTGLALAVVLAAQVSLGAVVVLDQETFGGDPGGDYSVLGGGNFNGSSGFESGFGNTTADIENRVPGGPATGGTSPSGNGSTRLVIRALPLRSHACVDRPPSFDALLKTDGCG